MAEVARFPWEALERLTRREVAAARRARGTLAGGVSAAELAVALGQMVKAPVELAVTRIGLSPSVPAGTVDVWLTPDGDQTRVYVALETGLVAALSSAVLGGSAAPQRPDAPPSPELFGAGAALLIALLRRVSPHPWRLSVSRALPDAVWLDVVALVGDQVYGAWIAAPVPSFPHAPRPFDRQALASLAEVPIELAIVAAVGQATRDELTLLEPGSAWLPGEGWSARLSADNRWTGAAWLAAGPAEVGIPVRFEQRTDGLALVVSNGPAALPWVVPERAEHSLENQGERAVETTDTVTDALEGAPVVLRVEIGTVTLAAGEWARLAVGDVIGTGLRLGEPVTLRAGGAVYARGELCEVEGELAVRLLSRGERSR